MRKNKTLADFIREKQGRPVYEPKPDWAGEDYPGDPEPGAPAGEQGEATKEAPPKAEGKESAAAKEDGKESQHDALIRIGLQLELFHDPDGYCFAVAPVEEGRFRTV